MIELYEKIETSKNELRLNFSDDFLKTNSVVEDFWIKYSDIDLTLLDESILNIPVLSNIAPVIWALDIDVSVPVIDKNFYESLEKIRLVFKDMYPNLAWSGNIRPDKLVESEVSDGEMSALFFSGGLDSVFSTMNHLNEKPFLVTVRGSDVALNDDLGWNLVKNQTKQFAALYTLPIIFIEVNIYQFLNQSLLAQLDPEIPGWWAGVQHGLGFAGLMSPYASTENLSKAYIASTHSKEFNSPWGSSPEIDNQIKYLGLQFFHDGYEFTRHGKVKEMIRLSKENNVEKPLLRVCYSNTKNAGENCFVCEKCSRTMTALLVELKDPLDFGFKIDSIEFTRNVKNSFENYKFYSSDNTVFMWQDIQKDLKDKVVYEKYQLPAHVIEYLDWLRGFDFALHKEQCERKRLKRQKIISFIKKVPSLYEFAKFVKNKIGK